MSACAHALCLPYGGCQFDSAVHTDAHGNVVDTCGHCTLRTFAGITVRSIQSGCPVHSGRDSTAPRRVPTEVERAAAAVEAGHAWRRYDVPGPRYILGARPAPECLTSHPQMHADCDGCTCSCHPSLARVLAEHLPAIGEAVTEILAAPRRRWWHRLTRRNP